MELAQYRRDIDGLRAIAVLLVVLYHAGFAIPGGYIGVDVFFVISGYLITAILARKIGQRSFSYATFYNRRIKRLLPALVMVIVATFGLNWFFLLPDTFVDFLKSIRPTLLGVSNFHFLDVTGDYFAADAAEMPLLHTWSLAVEEQFYVVWPPLMLILFTLARRFTIAPILVVLLISLVLLSEWMVRVWPEAAYYMLPARAFELLIGGILSLGLLYHHIRPPSGPTIVALSGSAGLALIFTSAFTLQSQSAFPGFNAIAPCVGTALLLWSGSGSQSSYVQRVLTWSPLVLIGLISYSLYLWHWPLVAQAHYLNIDLVPIRSALLVLVAIGLSWLTWRWVETPCRALPWRFTTTFTVMLLLPLLTALQVTKEAHRADGMPGRLSEPLQAVAAEVLHDNTGKDRFAPCFNHGPVHFTEPCLAGAPLAANSTVDVVLVGDSHANSAIGFFEVLAEDADLSILNVVRTQSPFLLEVDRLRHGRVYPAFRSVWSEVFDYLQDIDFDGLLVLGARWSKYIGTEQFVGGFDDALEHTLTILADTDMQVVIYLEVPALPADPSTGCRVAKRLENRWINSGNRCIGASGSYPLRQFKSNQRSVSAFWAELARRYPHIRFIDPKGGLCDTRQCINTLPGGELLYKDSNHLLSSGSRWSAQRYLEVHANPLADSDSLDPGVAPRWQ